MFGFSITEVIVVFVVALLLFGPEQLPILARQLGKLMGEVKKGSDAVRKEFYNSVYVPSDEIRRDFTAEARQLRALRNEVLAPLPPPSSTQPSSTDGNVVSSLPLPTQTNCEKSDQQTMSNPSESNRNPDTHNQ